MTLDLKFLKANQCLLRVELTITLMDGAPERPVVLICTATSLTAADVLVNWISRS